MCFIFNFSNCAKNSKIFKRKKNIILTDIMIVKWLKIGENDLCWSTVFIFAQNNNYHDDVCTKQVSHIWKIRFVGQSLHAALQYFIIMLFCHTFINKLLAASIWILHLAILNFWQYSDELFFQKTEKKRGGRGQRQIQKVSITIAIVINELNTKQFLLFFLWNNKEQYVQ